MGHGACAEEHLAIEVFDYRPLTQKGGPVSFRTHGLEEAGHSASIIRAGQQSMLYSIALGVALSLIAFGVAAFIMDKLYRPTFWRSRPGEDGKSATKQGDAVSAFVRLNCRRFPLN